MRQHFDPKVFPNRIIFVDLNSVPPVEKMNCLECGRLVERMWKNDELCESCYGKWQKAFREAWARERFGLKPT